MGRGVPRTAPLASIQSIANANCKVVCLCAGWPENGTIVAFKTLDISQGSVATRLRFGGIYSDFITNFLLILIVK